MTSCLLTYKKDPSEKWSALKYSKEKEFAPLRVAPLSKGIEAKSVESCLP